MSAVQRPGLPVTVWSIQVRPEKTKQYTVRWRVGTRPHSKGFATKAPADDYRSRLIVAVNDSARFDPNTGEPVAWHTNPTTVLEWATEWVAAEWSSWLPNTRRSTVEALTRAVTLLVPTSAPAPPDGLRQALADHLRPDGDKLAGTHKKWMHRWSLPLADLDRVRCANLSKALAVGNQGQALSTNTATRYRTVAKAMIHAAVDTGVIDTDPWPLRRRTKKKRANDEVGEPLDPAKFPSPAQFRLAVAAMRSHQPASNGYAILTALVFFAGLRPSEARAVRVSDMTLPEMGWGELRLRRTVRAAGSRWAAELEEETGAPKADSNRDIPLPPEMVRMLHTYLAGRTTGQLVVTRKDGMASPSNWTRAWHRARIEAGIVCRLYDLRHTYASLALSAGAPPVEVARRMGHDVGTLLRIYAHALPQDATDMNALLDSIFE